MGVLDKVLKVFVGDKAKQYVKALSPLVDKIKTFYEQVADCHDCNVTLYRVYA